MHARRTKRKPTQAQSRMLSASQLDALMRQQLVDNSDMKRRVAFHAQALIDPNKAIQDDAEPTATGSYESYLRINIGGKSYCIRSELYTQDKTFMHDIIEASHEKRILLLDGYDIDTGEYYLERNNRLADHVMDFFATGSLHKPHNVCPERFREELAFWKISHDHLSTCCAFPATDSSRPVLKQSSSFHHDDYVPDFDGACLSAQRLAAWQFLEDPQSSIGAAAFALISVFFVFASVLGLILGSMPEFQEDASMAAAYHNMHVKQKSNELVKFSSSFQANEEFPDFKYKPTDSPSMALVILEYVCIGWFTFEYFIRIIIYPKKKEFAKKTLNIIDMLTILPFYLELCLPLLGVESRFKELTGAMLVVRVLRVLRMARVFKLARYSTSLQTFGHTLKSSITELSMLSMFLVTGIIFFSTIMYYLEKDEPHTDFYSIPAGCWWCVVTMATVGYGDAKPVTTFGKLVATATSICGIIVLAFPISMIVEKFASAQQKAIEDDHLHQAQMSAVANNYLLRRFPTRRKIRRAGACANPLVSTVA